MNKEETQMMAFQLIGFAGDAFSHFFQAIDAAKKADYEEAERLIQEGKKSMMHRRISYPQRQTERIWLTAFSWSMRRII